jgi:protein-S-isoprenylcysteine O-methyltransferase Ste14
LLLVYYVQPSRLPAFTSNPEYEYVRAVATVMCVTALALHVHVGIPSRRSARLAPGRQNRGVGDMGPYRRIRHPFYASYVLFFLASLLMMPTWPVLVTVLYLFAMINYTAAREEAELVEKFGSEYEAYLADTGRFFPRLGCWNRRARSAERSPKIA